MGVDQMPGGELEEHLAMAAGRAMASWTFTGLDGTEITTLRAPINEFGDAVIVTIVVAVVKHSHR